MENKILVADDSPTIQKVISITLANKDYELDTAQSEDELFEKLNNINYRLVLLDYNLSDTAAGVEIAKQIKERCLDTMVMAMLGTFDSVEESILEDAGFSDKIVKPFESSKFIQKIDSLLSDTEESGPLDDDIFASDADSEAKEEESSESFDSDEWSIDGPSVIEEESSLDSDNQSENPTADPLAAEMAGWGMSVPEVIGSGGETDSILPPSIEATEVVTFSEGYDEGEDEEEHEFSFSEETNDSNNLDEHNTSEIPEDLKMESVTDEEGPTFPEDEDLLHPDMSTSTETDIDEGTDRHPQLTSLDELESFDDDDDNEDLDVTDPQIIIGPSEDSPDLINAINDDISPDDFWAADVEQEGHSEDLIEDEKDSRDELVSLGDEEDEDDFTIDEHPTIDEGPMTTELSATSKATLDALEGLNDIGPKLESENSEVGPKLEKLDTDSLAQRIKTELLNELKPLIKEMVKEALEETNSEAVEKVAWEVIPDLAENLIRKEVKELSQRVMDKHSLS